MSNKMSLHLSILAFQLVYGCGQNNPNREGVSSGIKGTKWSGVFTPIVKAGEKATTTKVKFHFHEEETFQLSQTDNLSSNVNGSYRDMPKHRNLIMDIKESSFDSFGVAGSSRDFKYSLDGNELELNGNEGKYSLIQEDSGTNADGSAKASLFDGDWQCTPKDNSTWKINIADQSFRGSKAASGKKTIYFEGAVENYTADKKQGSATLKIKSSNYAGLVDKKLALETKAESKKLTLTELDNKGAQAPNTLPVECDKRE